MKMKLFVLLEVLMMVFASDKNDFVEADTAGQSFVVKIEDDENVKVNKRGESKYIGVIYKEARSKWEANRWSTNEKKIVYSGYYKNEETAASASDNLARKLIANDEKDHELNFPENHTEMDIDDEISHSIYNGVSYQKRDKTWGAQRWSKKQKKLIYNGYYKDEETAAHASDTLARKLIAIGEQSHKLNFHDDHTEVYPKETITTSKYIGVCFYGSKWGALRRSKNEKKMVYNGNYKDEETAAHASDTLARKLIANGEKDHKLNFPDGDTLVYREKRANFIGVHYRYDERNSKWAAQRRSKITKKMVYNGTTYKDEETAAHASDSLARKLLANGEKGHKLNFPNDNTEVHPEKRTNYIGVHYNRRDSRWTAQRRGKEQKKMVYNGTTYGDEKTAAYASDILARKLMANGERDHKLNFPDDNTEINSKEMKYQKKRKRRNNSENSQDEEFLSD